MFVVRFKTPSDIVIDAPNEHVWDLLINLPAWSSFTDSIRNVELESELGVDSYFKFRLYNFSMSKRQVESFAFRRKRFSQVARMVGWRSTDAERIHCVTSSITLYG